MGFIYDPGTSRSQNSVARNKASQSDQHWFCSTERCIKAAAAEPEKPRDRIAVSGTFRYVHSRLGTGCPRRVLTSAAIFGEGVIIRRRIAVRVPLMLHGDLFIRKSKIIRAPYDVS